MEAGTRVSDRRAFAGKGGRGLATNRARSRRAAVARMSSDRGARPAAGIFGPDLELATARRACGACAGVELEGVAAGAHRPADRGRMASGVARLGTTSWPACRRD